jgi:hypothetical protein
MGRVIILNTLFVTHATLHTIKCYDASSLTERSPVLLAIVRFVKIHDVNVWKEKNMEKTYFSIKFIANFLSVTKKGKLQIFKRFFLINFVIGKVC